MRVRVSESEGEGESEESKRVRKTTDMSGLNSALVFSLTS